MGIAHLRTGTLLAASLMLSACVGASPSNVLDVSQRIPPPPANATLAVAAEPPNPAANTSQAALDGNAAVSQQTPSNIIEAGTAPDASRQATSAASIDTAPAASAYAPASGARRSGAYPRFGHVPTGATNMMNALEKDATLMQLSSAANRNANLAASRSAPDNGAAAMQKELEELRRKREEQENSDL